MGALELAGTHGYDRYCAAFKCGNPHACAYNYFNKCASSGHIEEERHRAPERELKFMHACYDYDVVREYGPDGPINLGRRKINMDQAKVVLEVGVIEFCKFFESIQTHLIPCRFH